MTKILKATIAFVWFFSIQSAFAQTITVSGTITEADTGLPVPGMNVVQQGTANGTSSDFDGNYTIDVPGDATLEFTALGYASQTISVDNRTTINVTASSSTQNLDEVVVTALGIKKETKVLGYSVTQVEGEDIASVKTPNAINSLQGKIAGVNITQNSTGAAGSTRVVIRGNSTLTGNNQPLYVVDGIPIGNDNNGAASIWGGNDGGDGISSLAADNIESISVLKGGAATALYGSRGGNGVILITTKKGVEQQGLGVEYSTTIQFDRLNTSLRDFQTEYGQGVLGRKPVNQAEALEVGLSSWGPRLDGTSVVQWDGVERPYSYVGDNLSHFYRTGTTLINTIAVTNGTENSNFRFSATDFNNDDIMPNSGFNRKTFSLNTGVTMAEKLTVQLNSQYILENADNRIRLSDSPGNANYTVGLLSPSVDVRTMDPGNTEDGTERVYSNNVFSQNPYWVVNNFRNADQRNRIIASTTVQYDFFDWLYLRARVGTDHYTRKATTVEPYGTAYIPLGSMNEQERRYTQIDSDLILGINRDVTEKIGVSAFFGANKNSIEFEELNLGGRDFIVPGLEDISNLTQQDRSRFYEKREIGSLYGSVELSYNNYAYLTITGRNDWFSTLSFSDKETPNNNFYSSITGSLILSDMFPMPSIIDFLKLRGGYSGTAGGADEAYRLALTYEIFGQGHLDQPLGRVDGNTIPNANLVPWNKSEIEIGFDARLFKNRLSLDFAYYTNETTNDIVDISTSITSGYSSATANLGKIENKGLEILLSGTPVQKPDFSWNTSINLTYNEGIVTATDAENNDITLEEPRTRNVNVQHIVGQPYGVLYGTYYVRDNNGNIVYDIDDEGIPIARRANDRKILGQGVPPWQLGFTNTFRYKKFNLNFLIDAKFGGQLFSGTNTLAYSGSHVKVGD